MKIILDRNPAAFDSKFLSVSFFSIALFIFLKLKQYSCTMYSMIPGLRQQHIKVGASAVKVCVSRNTVSALRRQFHVVVPVYA